MYFSSSCIEVHSINLTTIIFSPGAGEVLLHALENDEVICRQGKRKTGGESSMWFQEAKTVTFDVVSAQEERK